MRKEKRRSYTFDFYCLSCDAEDLFSLTVTHALKLIEEKKVSASYTYYGCIREIFDLKYREDSQSFSGQIRKIRKADLPEVGVPGMDSRNIKLEEDEGVVERNYFVYYSENSLLVLHRNDDGNSANHLAQLLSATHGVSFFAEPLIKADQASMLLNNKLDIKKFSVKIPRPTNPEIYPQNSISGKTIELLNQAGADSLDITFTVDKKLDDSAGKLSGALQSAIRDLLSMGATKAKLDTDENGKIHPIDLIADRIQSVQSTNSNAHFPASSTMYSLADAARADQRKSLDDYFGKSKRLR